MSFPKYKSYKDSGVEWLGEVPEHWEATTIKRFCDTITDGAHVSPEPENGVFCFVSTKDVYLTGIDFEGCLKTSAESYEYMVKTGCRPQQGDVLFSKDGTIGRTIVVEENREFVVASSLIIIRPNKVHLESRFLNYLCQSMTIVGQVESAVKGAGLPRLSIQNLLKVIGVFPSIHEQRAIAAFLDRETSKIDNLISEQQRLIALLTEKRQAVISHAVTKGLNPDAPMKDSKVEWLGEVPEHWEVVRFRHLISSLDQGWSPNAESYPAEDEQWGVLKLSAVRMGKFIPRENKALYDIPEGTTLLTPNAYDVLISRSNTPDRVGDACLVLNDYPFLIISDLIYRVKIRESYASSAFVCIYLISRSGRAQIEADARGSSSTMVKLSQGHILSWYIPCPPITEQKAIQTFLNRETAKIDELIAEAQRGITLLQERRSALISAAVTGKIDVRGAVVQPAE